MIRMVELEVSLCVEQTHFVGPFIDLLLKEPFLGVDKFISFNLGCCGKTTKVVDQQTIHFYEYKFSYLPFCWRSYRDRRLRLAAYGHGSRQRVRRIGNFHRGRGIESIGKISPIAIVFRRYGRILPRINTDIRHSDWCCCLNRRRRSGPC